MKGFRLSGAFVRAGVAQGLAIAGGVTAQLLLARGLGADERGRLGFQLALVFVGSQVLALGLHWGLAVQVARGVTKPGPSMRAAIIQSTVAGSAYVIVALALRPWLTGALKVSPSEAWLGAAALSGMAMMSASSGIANAAMRLTQYNVATVAWRFMPVVVYLILLLTGRFSIGAALATNAVAGWSAAVLGYRLAFPGERLSAPGAVAAFRAALPSGLSALRANGLVYMQQRLDVILAVALLEPAVAGTYVVIAAAAELAVSPAQSVANVLFAALATGARAVSSSGVTRSVGAVLYIGLAVGTAFALTLPVVLPLAVGSSFVGGDAAVAIAPGIAAAYLGVVLHAIHTSRGYPIVCTVAPLCGVIVLAVMGSALSGMNGGVGIALAASAGQLVRAGVLWWDFRRRSSTGLMSLLKMRPAVTGNETTEGVNTG